MKILRRDAIIIIFIFLKLRHYKIISNISLTKFYEDGKRGSGVRNDVVFLPPIWKMLFRAKPTEEKKMKWLPKTRGKPKPRVKTLSYLQTASFYGCPRFSSGSRLLQNTCALRSLRLSSNSYRLMLSHPCPPNSTQFNSVSLAISWFVLCLTLSSLPSFLFPYVFDYMLFLLSFYGVVLVYDVVSSAISPSLCDWPIVLLGASLS